MGRAEAGRGEGLKLLFDELVELYCRYNHEIWSEESKDSFYANIEAHNQLGFAILEILAPKTVGDVMRLPVDTLRRDGIIYLIKRDASDAYDQIEGFIEAVWGDEISRDITPAQYSFDGLKLCEWIDEAFPL